MEHGLLNSCLAVGGAELHPSANINTGEGTDMHAWLLQKLQDERRDLLLHLEDRHRQLLEQLLARAEIAAPTLPLAVPPAQQMPIVVEQHEQHEEVAEKPQVNIEEQHVEHEVGVQQQQQQQQQQNDKSEKPVRREKTEDLVSESSDQITPRFEHTAEWTAFEWFFGGIILANAMVIAATQQYRGLQRGYELGYKSYDLTKEDAWPGASTAFDVIGVVFAILFTVEFGARCFFQRCQYLREAWCYFDACILIFAWLILFNVEAVQFNPTFTRLARVTKLLRLINLLRSNQMMDVLRLMLSAIGASFYTLLWSVTILWTIIFVGALLMVQLLESYLKESSLGDPKKHQEQLEVFEYFGTFYRALLTMFEVTFANWGPSCRILVENVDESYAMFYYAYRCLIGMAVLMVVQAVFIQQTMKIAHLDDDSLARQKSKQKAKSLRRVKGLFKHLDLDKDGVLEEAEFEEALKGEEMKSMLEVFGLEVWHIDDLFHLLDDGSKQISVDEFVTNVQHLWGTARSIDVIETKREVRKIKQLLDRNRAHFWQGSDGKDSAVHDGQ